jgi:hypothetical protein
VTYFVQKSPIRVHSSSGLWAPGDLVWESEEYHFRTLPDGVVQKLTITYDNGMRQTAGKTAAEDFVDGKGNGQVVPLAGGWRATHKTYKDISSWETV